jgi:hypothetical protein
MALSWGFTLRHTPSARGPRAGNPHPAATAQQKPCQLRGPGGVEIGTVRVPKEETQVIDSAGGRQVTG